MIRAIIAADEQLFLWLNNLGTETFDAFWMWMSNEFFWIPLYLMLTILLFHLHPWKKVVIFLILLGLTLYLSETLSFFVKETTERLRPCRNADLVGKFRLVLGECRGVYGFFSAHATNHFVLAMALSYAFQAYRYTTYVFFLWAAFVAYSRIYLGAHFPLDVIVGSAVGITFGAILIKILQRFVPLNRHFLSPNP